MKKFIPVHKRSKKEQKAYHALQRGSWGNTNPVSRKIESGKRYNRAKSKREFERS